jgi:hypothetical protein
LVDRSLRRAREQAFELPQGGNCEDESRRIIFSLKASHH